jgi:ribonucleoside-diphosphate reductase beta chain
MCQEYPELKQSVENDVKEAAKLMKDMEHKFINKMFEQGDLDNMKADDLKHFITKRTNEKLMELGYDSIFEFSEDKASELDWFYHLTGGHTHTDFFAVRPTDYAKAGEDENWDEDDLFD